MSKRYAQYLEGVRRAMEARKLRIDGYKLREIGTQLGVSPARARMMVKQGDRLYDEYGESGHDGFPVSTGSRLSLLSAGVDPKDKVQVETLLRSEAWKKIPNFGPTGFIELAEAHDLNLKPPEKKPKATPASHLPVDAPRFLTVEQVSRRTTVSIPTIWRWVKQGRFPKPVSLGDNTTRWKVSDLEAWEESLDQEPTE